MLTTCWFTTIPVQLKLHAVVTDIIYSTLLLKSEYTAYCCLIRSLILLCPPLINNMQVFVMFVFIISVESQAKRNGNVLCENFTEDLISMNQICNLIIMKNYDY